jgi:predicted nucleic acid-binding protein
MSTIVLLDAGPLGMVINPKATPQTQACNEWLKALLQKGIYVYIPEIADYEVRRELLRANLHRSLKRLDDLKVALNYLSLTTPIMLKAAEFWAQVRQQGQPTADEKALDGDVILAAQAASFTNPSDTVIIATTNVGHLGRLVPALLWYEIV